jgi:hypothetical protein
MPRSRLAKRWRQKPKTGNRIVVTGAGVTMVVGAKKLETGAGATTVVTGAG